MPVEEASICILAGEENKLQLRSEKKPEIQEN
jgi:hypothetical protein